MRTLALLLLIAAARVPSGSAQTRPVDVDGWSQIHWGMTLDQVRAIYPGAQEESNPYATHLTLPAVKIGDIPLHASAAAKNGSAQIILVSLWCHFGLPNDPPSVGPNDFETLKALLIQKYGHAKNEERKTEYNDPVHLFLWTFPSTSITLKLTQKTGMPNLGSLTIEYRAIDAKALDVL